MSKASRFSMSVAAEFNLIAADTTQQAASTRNMLAKAHEMLATLNGLVYAFKTGMGMTEEAAKEQAEWFVLYDYAP